MNVYIVEYTDTFNGEANYCWVKRRSIAMPDLTDYGYDGTNGYGKATRSFGREIMRRAKAAVGLTGVRGTKSDCGGTLEFRPYRSNTVLFIYPAEG